MDEAAHIYVHTPFCRRKCPYCDFYSVAGDAAGEDRMRAHADAIGRELELLEREEGPRPRRPPRTLYLGGGTPSLLPAGVVAQLIRRCAGDSPEAIAECTLEANPESLDDEKLAQWIANGVNRLSLGAQSFDEARLRLLGRPHTADQTRRALDLIQARRAGGALALSIDLIYAIPGQTPEGWEAELDELLAWRPDHVSLYALTWYEGVKLRQARDNGELEPVDDETEARLFETAHARLTVAGYEHYEISNYALPGHACRHNLAVWRGENYLGLGAAAHSRLGRRRWSNPPDVADYCRLIASGRLARRPESAPQGAAAERAERLMLGLRMAEGEDLARWPADWRDLFLAEQGAVLRQLCEEGLAEFDGRRLRLTPPGWLLYDAIIRRF